MAESLEKYIITSHAAFEMERRGIDKFLLQQIMTLPEQQEIVRPGRIVLQSKINLQGKIHLVRVFVDIDKKPAEVVTVYRTSKISKYWRNQS